MEAASSEALASCSQAAQLQPHVAGAFFALAACTVALAALLAAARCTRPPWWCGCAVCEAYLTSSWSGEFDNLCDWYAHLLRASPSQTVHLHVLRNVLTANPVTVDHMLRARFDNYPKGAPFSAILADFLGRGIFNVDGDAWLFQRKLAAAELASPALRAYAASVVASELRSRLIPLLHSAADFDDDTKVLDLQDVFRRFAFDCICNISFGLDPGCLELSMPVSAFVDAFDAASTLSARRAVAPMQLVWRLKRLLNVGDERRLRDAVRLVDAFAAEVIRQRHKLGGAASGSDLLSRFMGSISDDRYLRDIVVSFMLAGRDTVASALTAFFLLLSDHPEVAAAIRDDVSRVTPDDYKDDETDRPADSFSKLKDMHYVHAALYESMRLFPPVQFDSKFAAGDDTLPDGTRVTKGTRVTYHAYAMGRMESVWGPDCGEFRPERWLGDDGRFVPVSPYRYPVFQAGVRVCVGKDLALMEMKAVIVAVVRTFDLETIGRSSRRPKFAPGLTATFAGGLPVRSTASPRLLWTVGRRPASLRRAPHPASPLAGDPPTPFRRCWRPQSPLPPRIRQTLDAGRRRPQALVRPKLQQPAAPHWRWTASLNSPCSSPARSSASTSTRPPAPSSRPSTAPSRQPHARHHREDTGQGSLPLNALTAPLNGCSLSLLQKVEAIWELNVSLRSKGNLTQREDAVLRVLCYKST